MHALCPSLYVDDDHSRSLSALPYVNTRARERTETVIRTGIDPSPLPLPPTSRESSHTAQISSDSAHPETIDSFYCTGVSYWLSCLSCLSSTSTVLVTRTFFFFPLRQKESHLSNVNLIGPAHTRAHTKQCATRPTLTDLIH